MTDLSLTLTQDPRIHSAYLSAPSTHWPGLSCLPCVYVAVQRVEWKAKTWWHLECYLELDDLARTQWPMTRRHETEKSAAEEATAFVLSAVPMLLASLRQVVVVTPGDRMQDALEADWCGSPGYQPDVYGKTNEARREHERSWRAAHDWRSFSDMACSTTQKQPAPLRTECSAGHTVEMFA